MGRYACLLLLLASLQAASLPRLAPNLAPVVDSLGDLRTRLHIPGLAAAITLDGQVVWRGEWGNLTTTTPRDVASVTKTMAAVIALQEVERGRLNLQDAVAGLPGVQVRHLLSHTSAGKPGTSFHYNNPRYGVMGPILERSAGQSFARLLQQRVLGPSGMRGTRPGANTVSGVVSDVEDLARYLVALDGDELLGEREKQWMWMPMAAGMPYALGWYSQSYAGQRVVWHYGQLNGYGSSLVVKIPALRANLVVLSNSSLLSDAYHLESGDILRSPLGRSFLSAMVDHLPVEASPGPRPKPPITSIVFPAPRATTRRAIVYGLGL
ncbi:MAG: beta-lactamase family protein [Bryobacteraceae bacterium]|nr:beta-lactamase family protein [Bryobacteraceae bacterium]